MKPLYSSSRCFHLSSTINLAAIHDRRIGSKSVESLGGPVSVQSTILSHAMEKRLSFIRTIYRREFLTVSLTASRPGGLVDMIVNVVVLRNRLTKRGVDSIDSKCGSPAAVKGRDVSAGVIFTFWSSRLGLFSF